MWKLKSLNWFSLLLLLFLACLLAGTLPVKADGGNIMPYEIWANLKEGQQISVIALRDYHTAKIDLFVSITDGTGQPHEITFFVPLGTTASDFSAMEQPTSVFNSETTETFDSYIQDYASQKNTASYILLCGTVPANGFLVIPVLWPLLQGRSMTPYSDTPLATYHTESSQISIFSIDEDTDLEALITTTGLDSSVQEVLSRLHGQQIAIVKLRTQPPLEKKPDSGANLPADEPGLHMSWIVSLVPGESGGKYSYPLGTGASWAKPIELTRIYIFAPSNINFSATYPKLGIKASGHNSRGQANIIDYYGRAAYAVEDVRGDFGRIWRATYTQSNADEDIVIVTMPQSLLGQLKTALQKNLIVITVIFAAVFGLAFWVLAWLALMPYLIGQEHDPKHRLRWYHSLIYPAINLAVILIAGMVLLFPVPFFGIYFLLIIGLLLILGPISILIFVFVHARHLRISRGRAFASFLSVTLASNCCYLVFSLVIASLAGII